MHHQTDGRDQRRLSWLLVPLLLPVLFLLVLVSGAQAANGHGLTSSFGGETSAVPDPEPLSGPTGVAWSAKTDEIYVIDSGHNGIARFSAAGDPQGEFTGSETPATEFSSPNAIAVDNDHSSLSYGDVYVSDAGHNVVDKFEPEGKYLNQLTGTSEGSFSGLGGVAVDPTGNVWVFEHEAMDKFDDASSNNFVSRAVIFDENTYPGLAIDSGDNGYVISAFTHNVIKWLPGNPEEPEFFAGFSGFVTGVAVDPATDNVYTDRGTSLAEYPPFPKEGNEPEVFAAGALAEGSGVAVSATHTVYVADTKTGEVDVFTEGPKPAQPTAEKAQPVEGTSASLAGKLEGGESSYHFEYETGDETCKGGHTTPTVAATGSESVSAKITGLIAKTQYTFCLVAQGTYGQEPGSAVTFTTTSAAPVVEATAASVNRVEVALGGTVNPEREAASCVFEYGTTEAYGLQAPCAPAALGETGAGVPVTATAKGLAPDTIYDYRILATNGTGTQPGPNETFTTEVIPPTHVETAPPSYLTPTTALLGGEASPGGSATYYIEYGSPTCSLNGVPNFAWFLCASKSAEAGPIRGDSAQTVAPIEVTGLQPGTTYRYWIVAHNANGSERGEAEMFTTPAASAPVNTGGATTTSPAPTVPTAPKPAAIKPPVKLVSGAAQKRAEKLTKALKQCKRDRSKTKRKACEAQAHKRYGAKSKSKPKSSKRGK